MRLELNEVLTNPAILGFVRKIKERYPTKVYLTGGLVDRGWTERDGDIMIAIVKGQDGDKLKDFLATLSDWRDEKTQFCCRVRLPDFPLKIDVGDTDYFKGNKSKVEIET